MAQHGVQQIAGRGKLHQVDEGLCLLSALDKELGMVFEAAPLCCGSLGVGRPALIDVDLRRGPRSMATP